MMRREFLATATAMTGAVLASSERAREVARPHIATNVYPWTTFYKRDKKDFYADLDVGLAAIKEAGFEGYEPVAGDVKSVETLAPLLKKHGLEMRSFYVNSKLHDTDADASLAAALKSAEAAAKLGAKIGVTNPSPIQWGGPQNKTDDQLKRQAEKLDAMGAAFRKMGVTLAYHNHDVELRLAAREFHHMLTGTNPANVKFCLDAHWVFRGSGDSQIALFDAVSHYADRIVELHLRQSQGGIWTEAFSATGDIDYTRL
ncbi:MAG: sugar phosphate isomerase/epimerase family protein [Fimbriiglobus sp.]